MGQIYAFLAVLLFMVSHSQVKVLSHLPAQEVAFLRAFGILLFSLPLMWFLKISIKGNDKKNLLLRGIFGSVALFCYFITLQELNLSIAVLLIQLSPFFAILFSGVLLGEKVSRKSYAFFTLAFLGLYFVKSPDKITVSSLYFLGIVAAIFSALAYNYIRKLRKSDHPLVVLSYFQFVLLPGSLILMIFKGYKPLQLTDGVPILILITFSFLAQVCMTLAYQKSQVSKLSSLNFLSIPLSAMVGFFFFNESLEMVQALGIALVFIAVCLHAFWGSVSIKSKT